MADTQTTVVDTSPTFFSGWRPMIGWISALALVYQFIALPIIETFTNHHPPHMDMSALIGLITTLLGMSTMRTVEKMTGTTSNH